MTETKTSRAARRKAAAQARPSGEPEVTKTGTCHIEGTCASCYFWDNADPEAALGRGICREASSQLLTVPSQNGLIVQAMWPIRAFNEKCGRHLTPEEFKAKHQFDRAMWGL